MDLDFSEEQEMLRRSAREFVKRYVPKTLVREMENDSTGFTDDIWKQMAQLGWTGWVIPTEYGGVGGSFLDIVVLLDEMGRGCVPSPFFSTVILGALPIIEAGNEEQRQQYLPLIASGEAIFTLALTEASAKYDPAAIYTKATPQGDDYIIEGTKLFVPNANAADYLICAAKVGDTANGITLFLVDANDPGITCTPLKTISWIGHDKQFEVTFKGVKVSKDSIIGEIDRGWDSLSKVLKQATVALCAEMVGGAQAALEMSVEYSKERVAFGRPIGSYQALQHKMANMLIEVDGAWLLTYQAAWMLSEGIPCDKEIAMAKSWTSEAYRRVTADAIQIHGAYGFCNEVDTTLYYVRAKAAEFVFGGPRLQRRTVAQELGLLSAQR